MLRRLLKTPEATMLKLSMRNLKNVNRNWSKVLKLCKQDIVRNVLFFRFPSLNNHGFKHILIFYLIYFLIK